MTERDAFNVKRLKNEDAECAAVIWDGERAVYTEDSYVDLVGAQYDGKLVLYVVAKQEGGSLSFYPLNQCRFPWALDVQFSMVTTLQIAERAGIPMRADILANTINRAFGTVVDGLGGWMVGVLGVEGHDDQNYVVVAPESVYTAMPDLVLVV